MPASEPSDVEVDLGRIKDGIRRYWWLPLVGLVAGGIGSFALGDGSVSRDAELRISDSQSRLIERFDLELSDLTVMPGILNADSFAERVDAVAGEAVNYDASRTQSGLLGIRVTADDEKRADELLDLVIAEANAEFGATRREILDDRITELNVTIDHVQSEIDAARTNGSDDIAEILERSSLIGILANEQTQLARLSTIRDLERPTLTELRRDDAASAGSFGPVLAGAAGAVGGLALAALLGVLRRRVGDVTDVRNALGDLPLFSLAPQFGPDDAVAAIAGIAHRLGHDPRAPFALCPVGDRARQLAERLVEHGAHAGVAVRVHDTADRASEPEVALLDADAPISSIVGIAPETPVALLVGVGMSLGALDANVRRLGVAGVSPDIGILVR